MSQTRLESRTARAWDESTWSVRKSSTVLCKAIFSSDMFPNHLSLLYCYQALPSVFVPEHNLGFDSGRLGEFLPALPHTHHFAWLLCGFSGPHEYYRGIYTDHIKGASSCQSFRPVACVSLPKAGAMVSPEPTEQEEVYKPPHKAIAKNEKKHCNV